MTKPYLNRKYWLNDAQIRKALVLQLRKGGIKGSKIFEEVGLFHGYSRIDVLKIDNKLHGFEIKSDNDSLRRLSEQIRIYNQVFDTVTIVVGYRHVYAVLREIPEFWGVVLAEKTGPGKIQLINLKPPQVNVEKDAEALIKLLWRDEASALLSKIDPKCSRATATKLDIYQKIVAKKKLSWINSSVVKALKIRESWKVG